MQSTKLLHSVAIFDRDTFKTGKINSCGVNCGFQEDSVITRLKRLKILDFSHAAGPHERSGLIAGRASTPSPRSAVSHKICSGGARKAHPLCILPHGPPTTPTTLPYPALTRLGQPGQDFHAGQKQQRTACYMKSKPPGRNTPLSPF